MANRPKSGNEAKLVAPRHGEAGNVALRVDVPPEIKSDILLVAEDQGITIKEVVIRAINEYCKGKLP